jgi:hypothetical protein
LLEPEVGGGHDRSLVLVALVDERVELLEDPFRLLLCSQVLEMQEVHGCQAPEEVHVGALALVGVIGGPDLGQQVGDRVDRHRVPLLEGRLRDQHCERGLARADVARDPEPLPHRDTPVDVADVVTHLANDPRIELRHRGAVE